MGARAAVQRAGDLVAGSAYSPHTWGRRPFRAGFGGWPDGLFLLGGAGFFYRCGYDMYIAFYSANLHQIPQKNKSEYAREVENVMFSPAKRRSFPLAGNASRFFTYPAYTGRAEATVGSGRFPARSRSRISGSAEL